MPRLSWSADRSYDDATKKLIENINDGVDRFKDKLEDKWKVEKITRNGVTTDVSDAMKDWKKSAETMKDRFKSDYAANPDVLEFLQKSKKLDEFMSTHQGQTGADTEWYELRRNIVSLASAYNINFDSDSSAWRPTRRTDKELKSSAENLEETIKAFDKSLEQASKQSNVSAEVRKGIESSYETVKKAAKNLKDAVEDKKPAAASLDGLMNASSDLSSKLDSAGLTSAVASSWAGVQKSIGAVASALGRSS
ncbi:MAG: hypothetical protein C5B54_10525 [Acidobacteria bacterium]|nr:MAG: hypothetical protein C5B54_10525 [Acidobacteriota bacterium]